MYGMCIETPIIFANITFITLLLRIDDRANKKRKMLSDLHIHLLSGNNASGRYWHGHTSLRPGGG